MDNVTHTLSALAISHAGFNQKTRFATLALVIGANLPDVDIFFVPVRNSAAYLKYHRGITHSFLGISVLAAGLAAAIYFLGRRAKPKRNAPPLDARWLLAACFAATASHLLLDFTNHYGVRPFLPFDGTWYAADIMFILDPLLWTLLAAGLGLPWIFRLVSEELGARKTGFRRGAIFSLSCMLLLWGLRTFAHRRVMTQLDSHTYGEENPVRLGAFPTIVNPFSWIGVAETDTAFHLLNLNALDSNLDPSSARVFHKAQPSPELDAALKTPTAKIFTDFARFPWARVEEDEQGTFVTIEDLRFADPAAGRHGFVTEVELDKNLRVRLEKFSFSASRGRSGP